MDRELLIGAIACGVLLAAMVVSFGLLAWWQARREQSEGIGEDVGLAILTLADAPGCPCCGGRHCSGGGPSTAERVMAHAIEARRRAALAHISSEFPAIILTSYDTQELDRIRALWSEVPV